MATKKPGKGFENEVGHSLKALTKCSNLRHINSNNPLPMCDHMVWVDGRFVLLEEKETHSDTMSFRCITDSERKYMEWVTDAGCEGWVLIKWIDRLARAFAIQWTDWLDLEHGFGFDPQAKRNKPGSGSFSLQDEFRPGCFIELHRVDRKDLDGNSLGKHWDLSPVFSREVPKS